jgi:hypothetical protein
LDTFQCLQPELLELIFWLGIFSFSREKQSALPIWPFVNPGGLKVHRLGLCNFVVST